MITRVVDSKYLHQKARRIRARVPAILSQWGLPPKFNRWRLTQDSETGLAVLFGVLDNQYIAMHTSTPFSNYFDPRLLQDMANDLHMQVVSCKSDGLRYAFILDRGQIDVLPSHIEFPFLDGDKLFVRVAYSDRPIPEVMEPKVPPAPLEATDIGNNQNTVHQGVEAFLKVFDDIKLDDDAAAKLAAQGLPTIVVIDEEEFKKRVEERQAGQ
jgi:hypothetical protein